VPAGTVKRKATTVTEADNPRTTFEAFEWVAFAACGQLDAPPMFPHPTDEVGVAAAKATCAVCPVQPECLDRAIATGEQHGVWGGMTEEERRNARRRESRARSRKPGAIAVTIVPLGDLL
jgi:WhiB family redox-sensing transcriptional regulator